MNLTNTVLRKRRKTKEVTCFYSNKIQILAKLNSIRDVLMGGKNDKKYQELIVTKSEITLGRE